METKLLAKSSKTRPDYFIRADGTDYKIGVEPSLLDEKECGALMEVMQATVDEDGNIVYLLGNGTPCYINKSRSVQTCAFDATERFLSSLLGCKLDNDDRNWYKSLSLVSESGLPYENTLRVLQELVKPYGLGISEVILKKGAKLTEEQRAFMIALGCNPMAMTDRSTTNAEFEAMVGAPMDFRFRYEDVVYGPCVIAESYNDGAKQWASGGGHASYIGPRGASNSSLISVRYDRLDRITYHAPLPDAPIPEMAENKTLSLYSTKLEDGRTIRKFLDDKFPRQYSGHLFNHHRMDDSPRPQFLHEAYGGFADFTGVPDLPARFNEQMEVVDSLNTDTEFYHKVARKLIKGLPRVAPAVLPCNPKAMAVEYIPAITNTEFSAFETLISYASRPRKEEAALIVADGIFREAGRERAWKIGNLQDVWSECTECGLDYDDFSLVFRALVKEFGVTIGVTA